MSGFWDSELGEVTGSEADAFAKSFTQIPDGTMALARIDAFTNQEYKGFTYLQVDWVLTDGDFKGSKVQQKIKVFGGDEYDKDSAKTRHRALNMLKLLYQLFKIKPTHTGAPTDKDLALFVNKIAGIQIRETEPNEKGKQYNWVSEVHKAEGFKCETGVALVVTHTVSQNQNPSSVDSALTRNANKTTVDETDLSDVPW